MVKEGVAELSCRLNCLMVSLLVFTSFCMNCPCNYTFHSDRGVHFVICMEVV